MRAASTLPTLQRHHAARVTVFDHVRIFVVTLVLSAALTFILGVVLLGGH